MTPFKIQTISILYSCFFLFCLPDSKAEPYSLCLICVSECGVTELKYLSGHGESYNAEVEEKSTKPPFCWVMGAEENEKWVSLSTKDHKCGVWSYELVFSKVIK